MEQVIQEIVNQSTPIIVNLAVVVITTVTSYVGVKIKQLYTEKVNTQVKKDVVNSTVAYVNQIYTDLHGDEKLSKALEEASKLLNEKGIPISDSELRVLIESAVNSFNNSFNK